MPGARLRRAVGASAGWPTPDHSRALRPRTACRSSHSLARAAEQPRRNARRERQRCGSIRAAGTACVSGTAVRVGRARLQTHAERLADEGAQVEAVAAHAAFCFALSLAAGELRAIPARYRDGLPRRADERPVPQARSGRSAFYVQVARSAGDQRRGKGIGRAGVRLQAAFRAGVRSVAVRRSTAPRRARTARQQPQRAHAPQEPSAHTHAPNLPPMLGCGAGRARVNRCPPPRTRIRADVPPGRYQRSCRRIEGDVDIPCSVNSTLRSTENHRTGRPPRGKTLRRCRR